MTVWAVLAGSWCLAGVLAVVLPRLDAVFTPVWLLRLTSVGALLLAGATTTAVVAAASIAATAQHPLGRPVATGLVLAIGIGACRAVGHGVRVRSSWRGGAPFRHAGHGRPGGVLTVDDDWPAAFAVPGRGAVVVLTTGLCEALPDDEMAAVIRHERAHLRSRHHLYIHAVEIAACLNPLLAGWPRVVRYAAERQADESAAHPDRAVAARAVARAAMLSARTSSARHDTAGRIDGGCRDVVRRVQALQGTAPGRQRRWALAVAVVLVVGVAADLGMSADVAQDRITPEPGEAVSVVVG